MKALKTFTIAQLIKHLNGLGVEWGGSTTRKAPILAMIEQLADSADLDDKKAEMMEKGLLKGLKYPVSNLVGYIRYKKHTVTSDELADLSMLQERAVGLANLKATDPTVANTTVNLTTQMPTSKLRNYCKAPMTDNDKLRELVGRTAVSFDRGVRGDIVTFTMGLVEEIHEAKNALNEPGFKTELADVVWYSVANDMCLGFNLLGQIQVGTKSNMSPFGDDSSALNAALDAAILHMGYVKKFIRDYPNRTDEILKGYMEPLRILNDYFDLSDAYDLLKKKLAKRYPDGFDPTRVDPSLR